MIFVPVCLSPSGYSGLTFCLCSFLGQRFGGVQPSREIAGVQETVGHFTAWVAEKVTVKPGYGRISMCFAVLHLPVQLVEPVAAVRTVGRPAHSSHWFRYRSAAPPSLLRSRRDRPLPRQNDIPSAPFLIASIRRRASPVPRATAAFRRSSPIWISVSLYLSERTCGNSISFSSSPVIHS